MTCRLGANWHNAGYIYPEGYKAITKYRSSKQPAVQTRVEHECSIVGAGGAHFPEPTFRIAANDGSEPMISKSASGCWQQVCLAHLTLWLTTIQCIVGTSTAFGCNMPA